MKRKKGVVKVFFGVLAVTSIISVTVFGENFISLDSIKNKFSLGSIETEITEKFDAPNEWNGSNINKKVSIKNTGKSSELIRVSLIPRWVDENENPWAGDSNLIQLNLNENNLASLDKDNIDDLWVYGKDGYFYYMAKLESGSVTKELLKSVEIKKDSIQNSLKEKYNGKKVKVDVKVEAIQPNKDALIKKWTIIDKNIENKFLEILGE
ncbi:BsaA family SipW-dependent biofilm matrix protein [Clostridium perfringens]|uniref:BsaA family SipW-dependent biofilm matrix protein n=1 Tax=Clostridium perfringens TaxID=1502 RepID=UPI0030D5E4F7